MSRLSGPKKIIDLDATPPSEWKVEDNAVHVHQGRFWTREQVGCVLCVEAERRDAMGQTLRVQDGDLRVCLTHGVLEEIPYTIRREYVVKMGSVERRGSQELNETVLFPRDLPDDERELLIGRLIDVAAESEDDNDLTRDAQDG